MLAQVAQRGGGCPLPGNIQGQVRQGSEQPGLVEDVPDFCRGVGLDGHQRSLPTQIVCKDQKGGGQMLGSRQFLNVGVRQQRDDLFRHREGPVPQHEGPRLFNSSPAEIFGGHGMITKAVSN